MLGQMVHRLSSIFPSRHLMTSCMPVSYLGQMSKIDGIAPRPHASYCVALAVCPCALRNTEPQHTNIACRLRYARAICVVFENMERIQEQLDQIS